MAVWTLEIGGTERAYTTLDFENKLEKKTPTLFSATIEFAADIDYFDLVEIKKDGTTEWKGFLENFEVDWESGGRYVDVGGRDTSVIQWKKWCENFVNMHTDTGGFFGLINAVELVKLMLRTPRSDLDPDIYPNNKSGWGLDAGKLQCLAYRTSIGDPNYVALRRQGYGWRNTGSPFNSIIADVDGVVSNAWSTTGVSPYLDADEDGAYISSGTVDQEAIFSLENLSTLDATANAINKCYLTISWKPDQTYWFWIQAQADVYLSPDNGSTWYYVGEFGGRAAPWDPNPWRRYTFRVSHIIDTVAKADAARVKFVCKSSSLTIHIGYAGLSFGYTTGGEQSIWDEFDIVFPEEDTVGVYFESRFDNDSYPRNYGLLAVENNVQTLTGYTEVDPNSHITKTTNHIDFDSYNNEDAYVYYNFGVDYFDGYFDHWFNVNVATDPFPVGVIAGIWAVSNIVDDYLDLDTGTNDAIALTIQNGGAGPKFTMKDVYNGVSVTTVQSDELTEGETYLIHVKLIDDEVKAFIYDSSGNLFDTLEITLSASEIAFRYLFACMTGNDASAIHADIDLDNLMIESYTSLGFVNDNIFRDVIASWSPTTMSHLRIRITIDDTDHAWGISQLYIYKAEELNYRVMYEGGSAPTFSLDQYIQAISVDDEYETAIGPLNIPKDRLLNVINSIVAMCHDTYIPFETWLDFDSDNTFHMADQRGSDKHASISFVKATHLGGATKSNTIENSVQRVQVVGRGEGKRQDEVSSDWTEDTVEMANINTFFEDVVTEKTIANKAVADLLAQLYLTENAPARESILVKVNKDPYAANAYGVGDYVTITDSLTSTSGSQRIYNIRKRVKKNSGEDIKINVNAPRIIPEEAWQDIYNRLKQVGIVGTVAADWGGQALNENKVSAENALSTLFEKTAKNDVVDATDDMQDPKWHLSLVPTAYTARVNHIVGAGTPVAPYYTFVFGMKWVHTDEWMKLVGPNTDNSTHELIVEIRNLDEEGNVITVPINKNPKLTAEVKLIKDTGTPVDWLNGDYIEIGLFDSDNDIGFIVRFIKESGVINAYARWNNTGNASDWKEQILRNVEISDVNASENYRYKIEIITEKDNNIVIFNLYDVSPDNPIDEKYPPSVIAKNITLSNTVKPLYMKVSANNDNNAAYLCQAYVYNFKTEIERVTKGES